METYTQQFKFFFNAGTNRYVDCWSYTEHNLDTCIRRVTYEQIEYYDDYTYNWANDWTYNIPNQHWFYNYETKVTYDCWEFSNYTYDECYDRAYYSEYT